MGFTVLVLVIYVLATARLTRLVNADTLLDWPRLAVASRARNPEASPSERQRWATLLYFLECPWCVGFWLSLAGAYVPVVVVLGWRWYWLFPVALACSHLIGVASPLADTEDIEVTER